MQQPSLTIGLDNIDGKPSLSMLRGDQRPMNSQHFELEYLNSLGTMGAHELIGRYAMQMLFMARPDDFVQFPALIPEDTGLYQPRDAIQFLIWRTETEKTDKYLPIIDALMVAFQHDPDLSGSALPAQWPTFKAAFANLFKPGSQPR